MKIDEKNNQIINEDGSATTLYSPEGFKTISDLWVKIGWDQKYLYGFSWLGRPIIQNPDDMVRVQEVIYDIKPDYIIETGIAHGGSLIYYASILNSIGKGRVIGIDIEIRKHNREAIENHKLFNLIDLYEGSSIEPSIIDQIKAKVGTNKKILVILDSAHDYKHVIKELQLYHQFVSLNSYIVVTDGSQEYLYDTPRAKKDYPGYAETWNNNNPKKAAEDFVKENSSFKIIEPEFIFNEGNINFRVTHWPSAFVKRNK
jgi:cephalosporin hydroxylase